MQLHLYSGRSVFLRRLPVLLLLVLACACLSPAATYTVNCALSADNPPTTFATLGSALSYIVSQGQQTAANSIGISGTCKEAATAYGFAGLTIAGAPTATIIPSNNPNWIGYALRFDKSDEINVTGITFEGKGATTNGNPLVWLYESTRVTFTKCTFENNPSADGLRITNSRDVQVGISAMIQGNFGAGMQIAGPSTVTLGDWDWTTADVTTVQNNGGTAKSGTGQGGIQVSAGAYLAVTPYVVIQNNFNDGIDLNENSTLVTCCDPTHVKILNNTSGIIAGSNSYLDLYGVTLSGNTNEGIDLDHSAAIVMNATITGNGTSGATTGNGIMANDTSSVSILGVAGTSISHNYGAGVQAFGGSSVWFCCGVTVTGNTDSGVLLQTNSNGAFWGDSSIMGNYPNDLECTSGAVAVSAKGIDPGLGKIHCSGYTVLGKPGHVHAPPKPPKDHGQ